MGMVARKCSHVRRGPRRQGRRFPDAGARSVGFHGCDSVGGGANIVADARSDRRRRLGGLALRRRARRRPDHGQRRERVLGRQRADRIRRRRRRCALARSRPRRSPYRLVACRRRTRMVAQRRADPRRLPRGAAAGRARGVRQEPQSVRASPNPDAEEDHDHGQRRSCTADQALGRCPGARADPPPLLPRHQPRDPRGQGHARARP